MKQYLILQSGIKHQEIFRQFYLRLPDDVDPDSIEQSEFEKLADRAGVEWEGVGSWKRGCASEVESCNDGEAECRFDNLEVITPALFAEEVED